MDQIDLTESFCARPPRFAWFLGAGTSRMSGLPTASDIIKDLKRRYYSRSENQEISRQDMQNPAVQARVQSFMDSRGFPAQGADDEYPTYFEKVFGTEKDRQRVFLTSTLSEDRVTLTVGNRVLAGLLASGKSQVVFTTNFDSVLERAFAEVSGRSLAAFHIEGSGSSLQALNNEEFPLYCKLHGDFRYDSAKNLPSDLAEQDRRLADCMLTASTRWGFIVVGYSGRDASVMALFKRALSQTNAFPAGLFWTVPKGAQVLPAVSDLVDSARATGINARLVEIDTFDALMLRLWRNIADKPPALDTKVRKGLPLAVNIPIPPAGRARPLLRLNALPIVELPRQCLAVRVKRPVDWSELRTLQRRASSRMIFTKASDIWCWADREEIERMFSGNLAQISIQDLPDDIGRPENLHTKGFFEEGIVSALSRARPLISRSRRSSSVLIADTSAEDQTLLEPVKSVVGNLSGTIAGLISPVSPEHPEPSKVSWAEALRISIVRKRAMCWLVINPDIWIWPPHAREVATDFLDQRRRNRFNRKYNDLLTAWAQTVIGSKTRGATFSATAFGGVKTEANPMFSICGQTGFAGRLDT